MQSMTRAPNWGPQANKRCRANAACFFGNWRIYKTSELLTCPIYLISIIVAIVIRFVHTFIYFLYCSFASASSSSPSHSNLYSSLFRFFAYFCAGCRLNLSEFILLTQINAKRLTKKNSEVPCEYTWIASMCYIPSLSLTLLHQFAIVFFFAFLLDAHAAAGVWKTAAILKIFPADAGFIGRTARWVRLGTHKHNQRRRTMTQKSAEKNESRHIQIEKEVAHV